MYSHPYDKNTIYEKEYNVEGFKENITYLRRKYHHG